MIKTLLLFSALFSLMGGLSFARGLFISNKKAIELGVSRWGGNTDQENLKLPAVKDRIEQRKYGIIGAIFSILAFVLQIVVIMI